MCEHQVSNLVFFKSLQGSFHTRLILSPHLVNPTPLVETRAESSSVRHQVTTAQVGHKGVNPFTLSPPQMPNRTNPQLRSHDPGLTYLLYTALTRRLALHDIGHLAKGDAIPEDTRNSRAAVVEGNVQADMLHRVLYPQVHVNGIKKKKKRGGKIFKKLAHFAGHGHKLCSLHRVKQCGLIIL